MNLLIRLVAGASLVVVLSLGSGCSDGQPGGDGPMLTYPQAVDLVEQLVRENSEHLRPPVRLESANAVLTPPCSGPNDDSETGLVMVEHRYWLREVDPALNEEVFRQVRAYWTEHGYEVVLEDVTKPGSRSVVARHPENGFRVSLTEGQYVLSLKAQSNCVPDPYHFDG